MTFITPSTRSSVTNTPGAKTTERPSLLIPVFLFTLILPIFIFIGPLRLTPYRLLLLILVLPMFLAWLSDQRKDKYFSDWMIIFHVAWAGLAMVVVMGPGAALQPTGMLMIETFGAFFLARRLVYNAETYEYMVRWMFRIIAVLLPFALVETLTAENYPLKILGMFGPVDDDVYKEPRWGFDRVQGPFSHPILFGVFCGSAIGMVAFLGAERGAKVWRMWLVFFTGLWSLSSGPLTGFIIQILTIAYERTTRSITKRWNLIGLVAGAGFVTADALSNRTPFEVFISYFAFNASTAYNRIRIWQFGSASVEERPFFGIGLDGEWERPEWMSSSVDMFWLVPSMKFGLPAGLSLIAAFLYIAVRICRAPVTDSRVNACRTGLMISLFGLFIAGWTVHYWNATYVLICFLFGSGCWIFDKNLPPQDRDARPGQDSAQDAASQEPAPRRTVL